MNISNNCFGNASWKTAFNMKIGAWVVTIYYSSKRVTRLMTVTGCTFKNDDGKSHSICIVQEK